MATPGFSPDLLDDRGSPIWISELSMGTGGESVYMVRDLDPAAALEILGADPELIRACELPRDRSSGDVSLPGSAVALGDDHDGTLLAGRMGAWTFVYDDMGLADDFWGELSAGGRVAASAMSSVNAVVTLTYAVDGRQIVNVSRDSLVLETDLPGMPADLRAAFADAGTFELDYLDPGEPDFEIFARVVCALAGLRCTLDEVRRMRLVIAPY